ncbi:hypothetical protein [Oleiharenicola sp. Vm1]|uniref:hypothetical protein n=1 Tax=Oleiharenicola sp. Vm1 TaxID=3398393 RepID=UPI0039F44A06
MRPRFLLLLLLVPALAAAAELPAYFGEALARFTSDAPRGWAYTLTTTRGGETSVERYDPSRPHGGEWTLLQRDGRAPTADELERYLRYKASSTPPTARATFEKGDLDRGTFQLLREDATTAEFRGRFRADLKEPLLAHVVLDLKFAKQPAAVETFTLRLAEPFSPTLGVKMTELEVAMEFSPPTADRPSLPRASRSRFRGRLFFFKTIEEDLRIVYSDFTRVVPQR